MSLLSGSVQKYPRLRANLGARFLLRSFCVLALFGSAGLTRSACVDYETGLVWVGSGVFERSWNFDLEGRYAYVSTFDGRFRVVDLEPPAFPHVVAAVEIPNIYAIAVRGDRAYVSLRGGGLQVVNVSDPLSPVLEGSCWTPAGGRVTVAGTQACVAGGREGILLVDISDPGAPRWWATVPTADWVTDVAAEGGIVCGACGEAGLVIADLSGPFGTRPSRTVDTPARAMAVALKDGLALVADGEAGLQIIDPSGPGHIVGHCDLLDYASAIKVIGSLALVPAGDAGLQFLDVADPAAPRPIGVVGMYASVTGSVDAEGDRACVLAGDVLQVVSFSGALSREQVGSLTPEVVGSLSVGDRVERVAPIGSRAYLAGFGTPLISIDVSDPAHPWLAWALDSLRCTDVAASGSILWTMDNERGLLAVDVADPDSPRVLGGTDAPNLPGRLALDGGYAYLVHGFDEFSVADISDPQQPRILGSLVLPGSVVDVAAGNGVAFVSELQGPVHVIDVSDPTAPRILGTEFAAGPYGMQAVGSHLFVTDGYIGLLTLDIADLAHPAIVASCRLPDWSRDVVVAGGTAYVTGSGGLEVLDVSDPRSVRLLGGASVGGIALSLALTEELAYVISPVTGLSILPVQCARDRAAAAVEARLGIGGRFFSVSPNPVRQGATVRLDVGPEGFRVSIHDAGGREVRLLRRGPLEDQSGPVTWDGRDDAGRDLPAGLYFARAQREGEVRSARVIRIR